MRVTANGKPFHFVGRVTVADFIRARGLDPRHVVVERNGEPLERTRYEKTLLTDGDRLELVRAVAGGSGGVARQDGCGKDITRRADPPERPG